MTEPHADVYRCRNCSASCTAQREATFQYATTASDGSVRWKKQSYTIWTHVESGVEKCGGDRTLYANPGPLAVRVEIDDEDV